MNIERIIDIKVSCINRNARLYFSIAKAVKTLCSVTVFLN